MRRVLIDHLAHQLIYTLACIYQRGRLSVETQRWLAVERNMTVPCFDLINSTISAPREPLRAE
jgi:hypothetical protein